MSTLTPKTEDAETRIPGDTDDHDVLIIGSSISASMTACYLKQTIPQLKVAILGPRCFEEKRPIVGESLVEIAMLFFRRLGLGEYLDREHALKNGLSFYHKLNIEDPTDRRYTVHAPEGLYHRSRQLHRPRFDDDLLNYAKKLGARFMEGKAQQIELASGQSSHCVRAIVDGETVHLRCRWVIDASGRSRWLGKQVTTYTRPRCPQRSTYWFRLADFQPFLERLEPTMRRPLKYDLWYTTHHLMGHGNWVWAIPLKSKEHERLISVGITTRPDVFDHPMNSLDDFLAHLDTEHPAISEMVRSGQVLDTNTYRNYLYWADEVYSSDGWFLIGDAARSVDPLYSSGLSMTAVQIEQIGEIISRQLREGISSAKIDDLQKLWLTITNLHQDEISDQYLTMHDPLQACLRRYWNVCAWFNALLPLWFNGLLYDTEAAPVLRRLFELGRPAMNTSHRLISNVSKSKPGSLDQQDFDRLVDFDQMLNNRFDCARGEVADHFGRLFKKRAHFRRTLLKSTRLRYAIGQLPIIAFEYGLSKAVPFYLRRKVPSAFAGFE